MHILKNSSMIISNSFLYNRHWVPRVVYHTIPDQNDIIANAQISIALAQKMHL